MPMISGRKGLAHRPTLVIADISMPPGHGEDGLRAALEVRQQRPGTGVLILSKHYKAEYALDLVAERRRRRRVSAQRAGRRRRQLPTGREPGRRWAVRASTPTSSPACSAGGGELI